MDTLDFLVAIWGDVEGQVFVPYKRPSSFKPQGVMWPRDKDKLPTFFQKLVENGYESYFTPAIFNAAGTENPEKVNFKQSSVVWVDLDNPVDLANIEPPPTYAVESSEGHLHLYWKLTTPCTDIDKLELVNRLLRVKLGADKSGWDAVQLLRPVGTKNFKIGKEDTNNYNVSLIMTTDVEYEIDEFFPQGVAVDTNVDEIKLSDLPELTDIPNTRFSQFVVDQVKGIANKPDDRSGALHAIAKEMMLYGARDLEVAAVLRFFNTAWKKWDTKNLGRILTREVANARKAVANAKSSVADVTFSGLQVQAQPKQKAKVNGNFVKLPPKVVSRKLSEIEVKEAEWLWNNKWIIGLNCLSGPADVGKSSYTTLLAHRATNGDTDGIYAGEKINVGFFDSPESSVSKVVRQLKAYGNDASRIYTYELRDDEENSQTISIREEIASGRLAQWITEQNIRLLIIDPIMTFIGAGNAFEANTVRANALDPLARMAADLKVCVIFVAHHKKGAIGDVRERVNGSTAFIDVPRIHWVILPKLNDETGIVEYSHLSNDKNNEGEKRKNHTYDLKFKSVQVDGFASTVGILEETESELTVLDVLSENRAIHKAVEEGKREKKQSTKERIETILRSLGGVTLADTVITMVGGSKGTINNTRSKYSDLFGAIKLSEHQARALWYLTSEFPTGAEAIEAWNKQQLSPVGQGLFNSFE